MSQGWFSEKVNNSLKQKRIALCLQYDGSDFCGWQRQGDRLTIQASLEEAICSLDPFLRPTKVIAAGRTDAGVHAAGQVVHFDCVSSIPVKRWAAALNGRLPKTIRVTESVQVPAEWHACHSALYRRYRYTIFNSCIPNLFLSRWSWHKYQFNLDVPLMKSALEGVLGFHDFSAFQRSGSKRPNALTTVQDIEIERKGDLVIVEIQASGFLYGMVRLLVGQLVAIGEHRLSCNDFERRWKNRLRSEVKESAPAKGLCLLRVGYQEKIFSKLVCYDFQPKFLLTSRDSPLEPPFNS